MFQVREINDLGELTPLAAVWDALLRQTPHASFFQSLDWLTVYWRHYGRRQRLRVMLVERGGEAMGVVPLVVRREWTRIGRLRVLTYPLDDWGAFFGPIGPQPREALLAALGHVRQSPRDWDMLDLRWVNPQTHGELTLRAMRGAGFSAYPQQRLAAGLIDLHAGWDDYWNSLTSHWRNNVRRAEKKLHAAGDVSYEHYRPAGLARGEGDPRWDLYDACEDVARRSWQASAKGTTLSHTSVRLFLRDVHAAAAAAGAVDLHLLGINGQATAFAYNYCLRGYVFGLRMGYDRALSRDGAGTLLTRHAIETCCRLGDHTYDFGAQYLDCKRPWITSRVPVYRYTHFPWSAPRAQVLRVKRVLQGWLNAGKAEANIR